MIEKVMKHNMIVQRLKTAISKKLIPVLPLTPPSVTLRQSRNHSASILHLPSSPQQLEVSLAGLSSPRDPPL